MKGGREIESQLGDRNRTCAVMAGRMRDSGIRGW